MGTALVLYDKGVRRNEQGLFQPGTQPGPGRNSLYSAEKGQAICDNLAKGAPPLVAAQAAGVCKDTYYHWCETVDGFSDLVARARAECHVEMAGVVTKAARGEVPVRCAEPAIELLKRQDRANWGDAIDIRKIDAAQLLALLQSQAESAADSQPAIEDSFDVL